MSSFEQAFAEVQKAAESAAQAGTSVARAAKALSKAAREGDIGKLRKAAERLSQVNDGASQAVANARESWPFTEDREEAYMRGGFAHELLQRAKADGVEMFARDEGLVAFPFLLKVLPVDRAIRVDRKRITALRPSHFVATLKAVQAKKSRFDVARFLDSLYRAYVVLRKEAGETISLERVYDLLTLLPGSAAEYGKTDFGRDLLMLDQSGLTRTKNGSVVSLPASTGTKGSRATLSIVGPDGNVVTYYGIRFTEPRK